MQRDIFEVRDGDGSVKEDFCLSQAACCLFQPCSRPETLASPSARHTYTMSWGTVDNRSLLHALKRETRRVTALVSRFVFTMVPLILRRFNRFFSRSQKY